MLALGFLGTSSTPLDIETTYQLAKVIGLVATGGLAALAAVRGWVDRRIKHAHQRSVSELADLRTRLVAVEEMHRVVGELSQHVHESNRLIRSLRGAVRAFRNELREIGTWKIEREAIERDREQRARDAREAAS